MIRFFRTVAYLEGISFLVLLFIAMPLKYVWAMPLAVRVTGSAHGGLFIAYCAMAFLVGKRLNWDAKTGALAFIAAFLPFGPFVLDRKLLADAE